MDGLIAQARHARAKARDWDELLLDRTRELHAWIVALRAWSSRVPELYAYINNHYAGCAPLTAAQVVDLWRESAGSASTAPD